MVDPNSDKQCPFRGNPYRGGDAQPTDDTSERESQDPHSDRVFADQRVERSILSVTAVETPNLRGWGAPTRPSLDRWTRAFQLASLEWLSPSSLRTTGASSTGNQHSRPQILERSNQSELFESD